MLEANAESFIDAPQVKSCRDWDDARVSDIEPRFTCQACGTKGAVVRPNKKQPCMTLRTAVAPSLAMPSCGLLSARRPKMPQDGGLTDRSTAAQRGRGSSGCRSESTSLWWLRWRFGTFARLAVAAQPATLAFIE